MTYYYNIKYVFRTNSKPSKSADQFEARRYHANTQNPSPILLESIRAEGGFMTFKQVYLSE